MKRVCFLFICLAILILASCTKEQTAKENCTLSLEQSPTLRGFKLRQNTNELKKRFPKLQNRPDNEIFYGGFTISIYVDNVSIADPDPRLNINMHVLKIESTRYPDLKGLDSVELYMVDDKIANFKITYKEEGEWWSLDFPERLTKFIEKVSESLNIKGEWQDDDLEEWPPRIRKLSCNGFWARAGFAKKRDPFVEMRDEKAAMLPLVRRQISEDKARESFKP